MKVDRPIYINITTMTIVKIILVFILFYFLFLIKEILAILFVALILASALDPWVDWMQKKKIPRGGRGIFYLFGDILHSRNCDFLNNTPYKS